MARSKSSSAWLQRHVKDGFVRKAKEQGYRSRAAYKLLQIDEKHRILKPGSAVLDLGSAPGSWSQVAARKVGPGGRVSAVDLVEMAPIPGVAFRRGDFRALEHDSGVDAVLCDVSPNISGIPGVDQARCLELALAATALSRRVLKPGGALLLKGFQGEAFGELRRQLSAAFGDVKVVKPGASRSESRETYLLARGPKAG